MAQRGDGLQIEAWAERMGAAGLTPLLVLLLELARPFGFLVGQALLLGEPLLAGAGGRRTLREAAEWLADPEQIDRLLARLLDGAPAPGGQVE